QLRIWITACATGEEAYSMAILVDEVITRLGKHISVKNFATDIDNTALAKAAEGVYPESIAIDLSRKRLEKYFTLRDRNFHISRTLRENIIFAPHNLAKNAGFTRMHLISCRNVLIYMQLSLQQHVMRMLHFSLMHKGILFLGAAETPGDLIEEFSPIYERCKIYQKRRNVRLPILTQNLEYTVPSATPRAITSRRSNNQFDPILTAAFSAFTRRRGCTCLLVNDDMELFHVVTDTANIMQVPEGIMTRAVADLVPDELRLPINTALHRAKRERKPVLYGSVHFNQADVIRSINVEVTYYPGDTRVEDFFMLIIENEDRPPMPQPAEAFHQDAEATQRILDLEYELQQTRENLQATIEELETTNEEQQATNEELLASNEELQSTNEELHSVNEELYTVNTEYQTKIRELTDLTNDVDNLLRSSEIGVIFLDSQLRVRKFTPAAVPAVNLVPTDVERPIQHITHNLDCPNLVELLQQVLETETPIEQDVYLRGAQAHLLMRIYPYLRDGAQAHLLMRIYPYLRDDDHLDGLVITFINIDEIKQVQKALEEQTEVLHQRVEREHLQLEITKRIRQSLDLQTIFDTACQEILAVLHADRVGIFKFDPESQFNDGVFIAEALALGYPSALHHPVHDHCFGENYANLYSQGQHYSVSDVDQSEMTPCHREILTQFAVKASLVMPLVRGDELWGLLCVHQCNAPRHWQLEEVELTHQLASQLAIANWLANLYQQVQSELLIRQQAEVGLARQLAKQQALANITERTRQSLNLEEILAIVVQQVKQLMDCDRVIVFRVFHDAPSYIIEEAVSPDLPSIKNRLWEEETWSDEVLELYWQGQPRIVPDVMDDIFTDCLRDYSLETQIQSKIVAPILQEDHSQDLNRWVSTHNANRVWGILVVHNCHTKRLWTDSEAQFLQQVANQLAIAIQQVNLFEQLQQQLGERQEAQQQLSQRNYELAISNKELARATRLKDEFLANMSHELRTPLNAILGVTEGLQDEIYGVLNKEQIKVLQTVENSGEHLLELINDILDLAKITSEQVDLNCTLTNLNGLCESSLVFIKHQVTQKKISLSFAIDSSLPDLMVDERRIRQVLINLLNNSVKFTPEGGEISLVVGQEPILPDDEESGKIDSTSNFTHWLKIEVIDTGIGIAGKDINQIFQPFVQVDSALNRQYDGTGLGLALAKKIIELHAGYIHVFSELGVGTRFVIKLPFCWPDQTNLSSSLTAQTILSSDSVDSCPSLSGTTPPLILLVEDNEANTITISSYLEAKGYRMVLATDGEEAINVFKNSQPNLILMDIQMPNMDGLEAIQRIRAQQSTEVPIIALTALAMPGDRERCLDAGANEYLSKPVKLKRLASMIDQFLHC
ncbi:MAG: GAF domain-containing protein, partial [Snowella sp.]|nr:GAF domain-containing protein [Snowella sp.]